MVFLRAGQGRLTSRPVFVKLEPIHAMSLKPKLGIYWASSCGGCEIAVVNLHEKILEIDKHFDFVFCPCLLDTKKKDVEAMADRNLAITLFNGAIRTEENEEMAHLLRRKSQLLVAYGACAWQGGIPSLSNLHSRDSHFEAIYLSCPTIDNPGKVVPQPSTELPEGSLHLPRFFDSVKALAEVVEVDYFLPGCPPSLIRSGTCLRPSPRVARCLQREV